MKLVILALLLIVVAMSALAEDGSGTFVFFGPADLNTPVITAPLPRNLVTLEWRLDDAFVHPVEYRQITLEHGGNCYGELWLSREDIDL